MRVALVNNLFVDHLGYFYVSAALKQAGHDVRMFIADRHLEHELRAFDPQLVGFTAVTGNHRWAASVAAELDDALPGVPTILGGPHATYHPQILLHPGLDFVCRGEGERPIVDLARALAEGEDPYGIAGIWGKVAGRLIENPFAPQIEDLDSIPFPDRSLYDGLPFKKHQTFPFMMSSRGCPWRCTFCYAPVLADLTKGNGKFVRFRSVDNVIREAIEIRDTYAVRSIEFVDDIFGMHRPWLREFSRRWRDEVGIGFQCNLRADLVNEETAELLHDAGCRAIAFGLESGNERVRNEILQKEVATDQIRDAAALLRRHRIQVITYNVLGSPTETLSEAWDTVRLNQEIRPDYAWVSVMQPYPGTKIHETAVETGVFGDDDLDEIPAFYHDVSPLKLRHSREIGNLQKLFNLAVWLPWATPLVRWATKLPQNPLYYLIFLTTHFFGLWVRVKRVPSAFLFHLLLNVSEVQRRHRSGLYRRRLPQRPVDAPSLRERLENGAL